MSEYFACFLLLILPVLISPHILDDLFLHYEMLSVCVNETESCKDYPKAQVVGDIKHSNATLLLKIFDLNQRIPLHAYESSIFSTNAQLIVEENGIRRTIPKSAISTLPVYEGTGADGIYASGSIINDEFSGYFMLGNGSSLYIEPMNIWNKNLTDTERLTYKANDVKLEDCSSTHKTDECVNGFKRALHCNRDKRQISCFLNATLSGNVHAPSFYMPLKANLKPPFHSPKNASCTVQLVAEASYYAHRHHHNLQAALIEMTMILQYINRVLSYVDFDGDGHGDGFALRIGDVLLKGAHTKMINEDGKESLLQLIKEFREVPQNHCLSLTFASVPLSTSWMSLTYAGGICKSNNGKPVPARNTAVINTVDPWGSARPMFITARTVAMAVGHMMGSAERTCSEPLTRENDWTKIFSACAQHNMANTLKHQGLCLEYPENIKLSARVPSVDSKKTPCGNGQLDPGEECDCGGKNECASKSSCCIPPGQKDECLYDRKKGYECDWSDSCCTRQCKIIPKDLKVFCGYGESSCAPSGAYCNGESPHCPVPRSAFRLRDGEPCGPTTLAHAGAATCKAGRCNSTLCEDAGLHSCMCAVASGDECRVCCKQPGEPKTGGKQGVCVPAEYFGIKPKKARFFYRYPGTPCSEVRFGHCNTNGACSQSYTAGVSRSGGLYNSYCHIILTLSIVFLIRNVSVWISCSLIF